MAADARAPFPLQRQMHGRFRLTLPGQPQRPPQRISTRSATAGQHLIVQLLDHRRGKDVLFALFSRYMAGAPASHETLRTVMTRIHEENPPMRSCLDLLLEMGEARGIRAMLEGMLRARFGDLPSDVRERLAAADADALQRWGLRVLTATRIDEVFADS